MIVADQLHVYAIGYQELSGRSANLIEVLNLDEKGNTTQEPVNGPVLTVARNKISHAKARPSA
jgi:DNA helicase II / ATP-dependent DNA helicase PcrA